jgi:hypothetical protein
MRTTVKTMMPIGALCLITIAGCASAPIPADKYARSQASVKAAEELNAANEPQAALHLKLAKQQLEQGKKLMKDGDNKNAALVLLRAESDGEAALNIARAKTAQVEAQRTITQIQEQMALMQRSGS